MEDNKLEFLKLADLYWRKSFYMDRKQKLELAGELHRYGYFSLSQIAKVVRLRTVDLTRADFKRNAKGGRFEPETLTALISMRQSKLLGERIPARLVEVIVSGGTSWSCASSLCGIPFSSYYKDVPVIETRQKRSTKFTAKDREAIVRAVRAGADRVKLAHEYTTSVDYIGEIYRSHANV